MKYPIEALSSLLQAFTCYWVADHLLSFLLNGLLAEHDIAVLLLVVVYFAS